MVSTDMGTSAASVFSIMVWDSPEKEEGSLGHRRPKQEVDERAAKAPAAPNPFKPPGPATHPRERADEAGTAAGTSLGSQLDPGKHKRGQEASGRLHPSLLERGRRWFLQTAERKTQSAVRENFLKRL